MIANKKPSFNNFLTVELFSRAKVALRSDDGLKRLIDFIFASIFFHIPALIRRILFFGQDHYCPICQSKLRRFLVLHRQYHLFCPVCRSLQRYRSGWLFLESKNVEINKSSGRFLHIAPEPAISSRLRCLPNLEYITADLNSPSAMVRIDICDIYFPNAIFDFIYCSHVLEHVSDDLKAMQELFRILKPGGKAIFIVPISTETTFESSSITDPLERQKLFGQHDHQRVYGQDFIERLRNTGFQVSSVKTKSLVTPDQIKQMGLRAEDTIFFAEKF